MDVFGVKHTLDEDIRCFTSGCVAFVNDTAAAMCGFLCKAGQCAFPIKVRPPVKEFSDPWNAFGYHHLNGFGITESGSSGTGILYVQGNRVIEVHGNCDATLGIVCVALCQRGFGD